MFCVHLGILLGVFLGAVGVSAKNVDTLRTVNVQSQFLRWPNPSGILYYIDPAYTDAEKLLINAAMQKVTADMKTCIGFTAVAATNPGFKVKITPFTDDGTTPEQFCYSYPGYYRDLQTQGKTEQRLVLARGSTGCFDGNMRSLMKYFAVLLGKRNEHQRADRDVYITINQADLQPTPTAVSAYRLYSTAEAYWSAYPYDYCSITHNRVSDFAQPGKQAFTVKQAPFMIPTLARLSNTDCQLISLMYPGCDKNKCEPLDCVGASTTTGKPMVTSPLTVVTSAVTGSQQPVTLPPSPQSPVTGTTASLPTSPGGVSGPTVTPSNPPLICTTAAAVATSQQSTSSAPSTTGTAKTVGFTTGTPSSTAAATQGSSSVAPTSTGAPTTPPVPRTPCTNGDFKSFCKTPPTASLLYQAGASPDQDVYVLISGNCAMRYKMGTNGANQAIDPSLVTDGLSNPIDIEKLYQGFQAFGQSLPITFAYLSSANGPVYLSNSAQPKAAAACSFPGPDPLKPCDGSSWPNAPLPGVLSTSAPTPAAATSVPFDQFYIYNPATKGLCLSNYGRPTGPIPASQCFSLTNELSTMSTVTAIQYINDPAAPALLVFGSDASGASLIAFGDAAAAPVFHPPTAPTSFNTFGGAFPFKTYSANMQC